MKIICLNNLVDDVVTGDDGSYSFENLPAGNYVVCEVQQDGWVQTYPANDACHTITIDVSGETNENTNFGNQGRGTITVKKDVDTDGDGQVDETDVDTWVYNINDEGDYATGTTQNVPAGEHEISEEQQDNYSFVSVSCEGIEVGQAEAFTIEVEPGQVIDCTFVNERDAGTLEIVKQVESYNETDDVFDLQLDGETVLEDATDNSTTGAMLLTTGDHTVGEIAGNDTTDLEDYIVTFSESCEDGNVTVEKGEDVVCTITNTAKSTIVITKNALPNHEQDFDFVLSPFEPNDYAFNIVDEVQLPQNDLLEVVDEAPDGTYFTLDDDEGAEGEDDTYSDTETLSRLDPGWYKIEEGGC